MNLCAPGAPHRPKRIPEQDPRRLLSMEETAEDTPVGVGRSLPRRVRTLPAPDGPETRADPAGVSRRAERPDDRHAGQRPGELRQRGGPEAAEQGAARDLRGAVGLRDRVPSCPRAGGCGRTRHCRSCAIRQCVTRTLETGESCRRTAHADIGIVSGDRRIRFLIETEKVNAFVRLTIFDVQEGRRGEDKGLVPRTSVLRVSAP